MSLFAELKRRNVFRVGIAYVLMGWVLLQGADFALDLVDAPNWVIQVFFIAVLIGLPIALFFAWAFEMTPEGIKREHEVDRTQSIAPTTGRKLDRAIIAFLAVALVLVLVERFLISGDRSGAAPQVDAGAEVQTESKTIAVLPFADLSQAQDQAWFADGLAEEILNSLVRVPDLQVTARTSSFQYRDSALDIPEIAAELGVAHVLEGSVRSSGERIRVTAQLIRASDGFHLWSENYDRDITDMIAIQEDLAQNIATALETSMDPAALAEMAQVGTESIEAYQEYLRGLQMQAHSLTESENSISFQKAYEHFERARSIDPTFARAHVQSSDYWKVELTPTRTDTGNTDLSPREMLREYHERIGLGIQNAASEADRLQSLADRAYVDLRLNEARDLFRQYLELRPNDELARFEYLGVVSMMSDKATLREILDHWKAKGLTDVYAANAYINEAYRVVDPSEAADYGLLALQRWPNVTGLLYQTHRSLVWAGRFSEASQLAARYETLVPGSNPLVLAREACAAGDRERAEEILAEMNQDRNNFLSSIWLIHNMLGNTREEIESLRHLEQTGVPFSLATFLGYHKFDPRPYPSLMAILEREGVERPPPAIPPFRCPPPEGNSIAVLPFINMSADADNEYFSDGVSEEILNVLAGIPNLKVTARTSAFSFKGSNKKVSDIADELGVRHILEGSVRKAGNQVRVTAQLIKAGDDFHLWSQTYDRELDNIFAIQDEIARSIAEQLKVQLELEPAQENFTGTTNTEAYDAYLRGVAQWHLRTGDSLRNSIALFDRAIELDPGFARAWAWLALTYAIATDYMGMPMEESMPKTRQAAERALELNPELVEAATALMYSTDDVNQQIEYARRALAISDAFATTHQWYATTLVILGDLETARRTFEVAMNLDPRSRVIAMNYAYLFAALGDWDRAEAMARDLLTFAPDYGAAHTLLFEVMLRKGDRDGAREAGHGVARVMGRDDDRTEDYLALYFEPEQRAAALANIMAWPRDDWWSPGNPSLVHFYNLSTVLAGAGAHDAAKAVMAELIDDYSSYTYGTIRTDRSIPGLVCREDVQQLLATTDLPPLIVPYPCEDHLANDPGAPDP